MNVELNGIEFRHGGENKYKYFPTIAVPKCKRKRKCKSKCKFE